mgnify:FL=1
MDIVILAMPGAYDAAMTDITTIESALRGVIDPELGTDIVDLGMVKGITVAGSHVTLEIALTIAACPMRDQIESDAVRKVTALSGVDEVSVQITAMTQDERSALMSLSLIHI